MPYVGLGLAMVAALFVGRWIATHRDRRLQRQRIKHLAITLAMLPSAALSQEPFTPPEAVRATQWAREDARLLGFQYPIFVVMERPPLNVTTPGARAYTVRNWDNIGCMLVFTAESILDRRVVAHEVAHCVLDYPYLTPNGYFRSPLVTDAEMAWMEARANRAEAWLVGQTPGAILARLRRQYPSDWDLGRKRAPAGRKR